MKALAKLLILTDLGIIGDKDNAITQLHENICGHPSYDKQNKVEKIFVQAPLGTRFQVLLCIKSINRRFFVSKQDDNNQNQKQIHCF